MSYRALIPTVAGLAILVAVAVATIVEVERDARRRARQGRGGQSVRATETLPPRPLVPQGMTGGEGQSVTALPASSTPAPQRRAWADGIGAGEYPPVMVDDDTARAARRLLDFHREG